MFDHDRFLRQSRRPDFSGIDWEAVPDDPLIEAEVRFLRYMMNIEDHTIVYLKELLATRAVRDPDVTAFLTCWAYEEFWHGQALERFLHAYHGMDTPTQDRDARFAREGRLARVGKRVAMPILSAALPDFAAVHMTWGATNELTTLVGYEQVARQTQHPILEDILGRIVKDERRHYAFYQQQAAMRLADAPRMQRATRRLMARAWAPVGSRVYDPVDVDMTSWYLFRDVPEVVADVDAQIASLPGMTGWQGLADATAAGIKRHEKRGLGRELVHEPPRIVTPAPN